ncbi:MAG: choice-of-anchor X domain-containing protein [candidate division Zixibacteria bacterium]
MKKIYRFWVDITVLLLIIIVIFPSDSKGQQLSGKVYKEFIESVPVADIARRGEINVHKIVVEKAREVSVTCSWHSGELKFELTDPFGNRFDSTARLSNYNVEYKVHRFPEGIIEAVFDLTGNFPAGIWNLEVTTEDKTELGIGYTIEVYHRNPELKTLYKTNKDVYKSDERVIITAILRSGEMPVSDATVRAVIARERDIIDTLVLLDDGLHKDSLANDGRYASVFDISNRQGDYYIHIDAEKPGQSPFARKDDYALMFIVNNSSIIGTTGERTVDIDRDGSYDSLVVSVDFEITHSQDYRMKASLYDRYGKKIAASRICDDFPKGKQKVEFSFDGSTIFEYGADGPYYLRDLILSDSCDNVPLLDSIDNVYATEKYDFRDFEHGPIFITGKHAMEELDIDNDGLIDSLILNFEVEYKEKSQCIWSGFIKSRQDGVNCWRTDNEGIFDKGLSDVRLSFSGNYLKSCPYEGIYTIAVVVLQKNPRRLSNISYTFESREYKRADFE